MPSVSMLPESMRRIRSCASACVRCTELRNGRCEEAELFINKTTVKTSPFERSERLDCPQTTTPTDDLPTRRYDRSRLAKAPKASAHAQPPSLQDSARCSRKTVCRGCATQTVIDCRGGRVPPMAHKTRLPRQAIPLPNGF